jgi:hypothetical protein
MSAQVAIREDATFVRLTKTPASVSVGLKNAGTVPLQAVLTLEWLAPEGKPDVTTRRTIELNPGESNIEIPPSAPGGGQPIDRSAALPALSWQ